MRHQGHAVVAVERLQRQPAFLQKGADGEIDLLAPILREDRFRPRLVGAGEGVEQVDCAVEDGEIEIDAQQADAPSGCRPSGRR